MSTLAWIIGSSFGISLIAFIGALSLLMGGKLLDRIMIILVAFAAGALMGVGFLHLIPRAIIDSGGDEISVLNVFLHLLLGFCIFFILEQLIGWHHHHSKDHSREMPFTHLILISDGIHNFIDGIVIAASFAAGLPMGIASSSAIALHEIPQEIGDFGILVYGGFNKNRALMLNYISATTILLGGISGYLLLDLISKWTNLLLSFAAGSFIYIASVDLIPEIRHRASLKTSLMRFCIFLVGLAFMLMIKFVE